MTNQLVALRSFYNVDKINFKNIDSNKLEIIMDRAKKINKLFLNEEFRNIKSERYFRIMQLINSNYRKDIPVKNHYATTSQEEKFLLFMFSIDPEFEIAKIYGSEDSTKIIKQKIRDKFGVYDPFLIKIEKGVIKKLLNDEKRNEIDEEIERRAFK